MPTAYLAIDLGASSGRAIVGVLEGDPVAIRLEEVHRFEHRPIPTPAGPVWDLTGIWLNILDGLQKASVWCAKHDVALQSVGVDTWGVDWTLVGPSGELIGLPHCYRDPQNELACKRVLEQVGGSQQLYRRTGIQLMPINTLFQVAARHETEPQLFKAASRLLMMPDLFHYWLSGELTNERTIASTSSMLNLETSEWDVELLKSLQIPTHVLGSMIEPGTVIGAISKQVAQSIGAAPTLRVIAPGSHDTASAVAAVPWRGKRSSDDSGCWAFLSSGTWSLLGMELERPFASAESCSAPFTNELGLCGTVRFLKNIAGLWLVQELRREHVESESEIEYSELTERARCATPFKTLIDPNATPFAEPGGIAEKIRVFARETDQPEPEDLGALVRCCLDSLALCYRHTVDLLESVLDVKVDVLHIVGGGTNNQLLNEITAATMNRPVVCGPVEATAIGNVLTQAMGDGRLAGLDEIRTVVTRSVDLIEYDPADLPGGLTIGDDVFARYERVVQKPQD